MVISQNPSPRQVHKSKNPKVLSMYSGNPKGNSLNTDDQKSPGTRPYKLYSYKEKKCVSFLGMENFACVINEFVNMRITNWSKGHREVTP